MSAEGTSFASLQEVSCLPVGGSPYRFTSVLAAKSHSAIGQQGSPYETATRKVTWDSCCHDKCGLETCIKFSLGGLPKPHKILSRDVYDAGMVHSCGVV